MALRSCKSFIALWMVVVFGVAIPASFVSYLIAASIYDMFHYPNSFAARIQDFIGLTFIQFVIFVVLPTVFSCFTGVYFTAVSQGLTAREKMFRIGMFILLNPFYLIYRSLLYISWKKSAEECRGVGPGS
ncbi:hypothetical protein [Rubinisphaera margarita]|uniref:hypothetical protein n=1 Tax=Rubinisphaera margarita TaxID=2909586 RepID=UPI001EE88701|nr:hypothetical protein [Rubinisphaera margarita]MCG6154468.1 hypothetical protein [Rubinisphaera margarita]